MRLTCAESGGDLAARVGEVINQAQNGSSLELRTSGTTGPPKPVLKDLTAALKRKRGGASSDRFLLTFDPSRWAGVSVILHCCRFGCELIVPATLEIPDILAAARKFLPTHISLTPTLLRLLMIRDTESTLKQVPFIQVTFGGEAATQSILDAARALWPAARVTHTYASTEHGDICAVSDGREGIPMRKFSDYELRGTDESAELVINGVSTGDLWSRRNDRYYFLGRKEEIINVGGNKVSPLVVEEIALKCGARAARVFSVPSPLTGALVGLDYVGEVDPRELLRKMREHLPKYSLPASANCVNTIEITQAGKLRRL